MKTIEVHELRKEAKIMEQNNPEITQNIDYLASLVFHGNISEQLIAYFSEILDNENRGPIDIQIMEDELTTKLNVPKPVCRVIISPILKKKKITIYDKVYSTLIKGYQKNRNASNSRIVDELRKLYQLPEITSKPQVDVIKKLKGMMKEYADEESAVDAIKEAREDLH